MDIIMEWKRVEERKHRHVLKDNQWENAILCLGSEGYSVKYIQEILTLGRGADQGIRDLWGLGLGKAPKWTADQEKEAYNVIWSFFKRDIEQLYHGTADSDGKVIAKGQSTVNVQRIIHENTGFKLPSQSMQNQMEKVWGFSMRKRPNKAKSEDPSTPTVKFEDVNATVSSEGQDCEDLQDLRVNRFIGAESSASLSLQSKLSELPSTTDNLRIARLENQVMILTDDFQAALAIGRSQGMALKDVENQLQRLNNEIALLKSKNSSLSIQNDQLRKKNCFLEARVDELLGFNHKLEADIDDLRIKTVELQEEVNNLDALKLENQNLRTQKAILLKEHALLKRILCQLVFKIQQLPSSPEHNLKNEVEKLGKIYDINRFNKDSPRDSVDSAYYSNNLDLETRQSLNIVPIEFRTLFDNQAGEIRSCLESDVRKRRHCKILQVGTPITMPDAERFLERETVAAKPSLTESEIGDRQTSRNDWRNDYTVDTQMAGVDDTPMQECVLPAGPVFTTADACFGDQWNDPIMFNPPQQIPNLNQYNQADEGFEDCM